VSKIIPHDNWVQGSNNIAPRGQLPVGYRTGTRFIREGVNVDILNGGEIDGRIGYARIFAATVGRGLLGIGSELIYGSGTDIISYNVDSGATKTLVGSTPNAKLIGTVHAGELFMQRGSAKFRYKDGVIRRWGVETVVIQPTVTATTDGALEAGTYKIAATVVNPYGEESGTLASKTVDISANGKMTLTNLPTTPADGVVRVYVSHANGATLYLQAEVAPGATVVVNSIDSHSLTLDTQFCIEPPTGTALTSHHGSILVTEGKALWIMNPMRPHLCRMATGFLQYPLEITNVVSVDPGVYITADQTYWVTDIETDHPAQQAVLGIGAVAGTALPTTEGATWMTEFGQAVAGDGGKVELPNKNSYAPVLADNAVAGIVRREGLELAVTVMGDNRRGNSMAMSDYYDVEVIGP